MNKTDLTPEKFFELYYTEDKQPRNDYQKIRCSFTYLEMLDFAEEYHRAKKEDNVLTDLIEINEQSRNN